MCSSQVTTKEDLPSTDKTFKDKTKTCYESNPIKNPPTNFFILPFEKYYSAMYLKTCCLTGP